MSKKILGVLFVCIAVFLVVFFVERIKNPGDASYDIRPGDEQQSFDDYPSDDTDAGTIPQ